MLKRDKARTVDFFAYLPPDWDEALSAEPQKAYGTSLKDFVDSDRELREVYPAPDKVFAALELTPLANTRVVILGQDPYHGPGQAHGLSFSVPYGVAKPPSLVVIDKELESDLGIPAADHGNLSPWARQGVLLLNTTLTVRRGAPGSHQHQGWEELTDDVIRVVSARQGRVVFLLWGGFARKKKGLIDTTKHVVIESAHPKARGNAREPFRGSCPFSTTNQFLEDARLDPIDWRR